MLYQVIHALLLTGAVTANCIGIQRFVKQISSGQYLAVEVLKDDVLHFETATNRAKPPGNIYLSQMVDSDNFGANYNCGPSVYNVASSGYQFSTSKMRVTIDPNTLAITVFDLEKNFALTTFTYANLNTGLQVLQFTKEQTQAVYGIATGFAADSAFGSPNGNFAGKKYTQPLARGRDPSATRYGNAMQAFDSGASDSTQFPIMYALGPNNYNWALFIDNIYPHDWDFTSNTYSVNMWGNIRFFVFQGRSLLSLRQKYLTLVGPPKLPSREMFGMQQSLFGYRSFNEVFQNLDKLKAANMPVDGIVLDLLWFGGLISEIPNGQDLTHTNFGSLTWDLANFPDPVTNVNKMRSQYGVGVTMIEEPLIGQNNPTFQLLQKNQALATTGYNQPPSILNYNPWWGVGGYIDWTSPGSDVWMDCKRCAFIQGCVVDATKCAGVPSTPQVDVTAHWIDLGEPEQFNDGARYWGYPDDLGNWHTNHGDVHNIYQLLATQRLYQGYQRHNLRRRPTTMVRTGTSGIQRYGITMWSGDVSCNLPVLGNHIGSQKHIIMAGIDFYGSDAGGFNRGGCTNSQPVTFTRWFMVSSWMDIPLRPHAGQYNNGINNPPDMSIETNPSQIGDIPSNKFNLVQRYQLVPYYYALAHHANMNSEPIFRPMFLAFQNDSNTWSLGSQFMLGNSLMVAIDANYGTQSINVYLPSGTWFDYHTHEKFTSTGQSISRPLTQNVNGVTVSTTPVLALAGGIVTKAYVDDNTYNSQGLQANGTVINTLITRVWPTKAGSSFVHVEDDGVTSAYLNGTRATTAISQVQSATSVTVTIKGTTGSFTGMPQSRQYGVEVVLPQANTPFTSVTVNGAFIPLGSNSFVLNGQSGYTFTENNLVAVAYSSFVSATTDKVFVFNF
ncbi:hypothetical protein HK103_006978 [Boothiomyces macroporosus]|uniref:Alpha-glucosidase n=1 Tax=Boothiomyces macroporosus TaxID=261099 RepID=A0AAD5YAH3_9FUNG|nr:hypothetical protein HK103_006978 [Boothiomyces macroporosus]